LEPDQVIGLLKAKARRASALAVLAIITGHVLLLGSRSIVPVVVIAFAVGQAEQLGQHTLSPPFLAIT